VVQPHQAEVERRGTEPVAQDVEHGTDPGLAAAEPGDEAVQAVPDQVDGEGDHEQGQALLSGSEG